MTTQYYSYYVYIHTATAPVNHPKNETKPNHHPRQQFNQKALLIITIIFISNGN